MNPIHVCGVSKNNEDLSDQPGDEWVSATDLFEEDDEDIPEFQQVLNYKAFLRSATEKAGVFMEAHYGGGDDRDASLTQLGTVQLRHRTPESREDQSVWISVVDIHPHGQGNRSEVWMALPNAVQLHHELGHILDIESERAAVQRQEMDVLLRDTEDALSDIEKSLLSEMPRENVTMKTRNYLRDFRRWRSPGANDITDAEREYFNAVCLHPSIHDPEERCEEIFQKIQAHRVRYQKSTGTAGEG